MQHASRSNEELKEIFNGCRRRGRCFTVNNPSASMLMIPNRFRLDQIKRISSAVNVIDWFFQAPCTCVYWGSNRQDNLERVHRCTSSLRYLIFPAQRKAQMIGIRWKGLSEGRLTSFSAKCWAMEIRDWPVREWQFTRWTTRRFRLFETRFKMPRSWIFSFHRKSISLRKAEWISSRPSSVRWVNRFKAMNSREICPRVRARIPASRSRRGSCFEMYRFITWYF